MELQDFPPEITDIIFSNLSLFERFPLELCSKTIRQAVINAPRVVEEVRFFEINYSDENSVLTYVIRLELEGRELIFSKSNDVPNVTNVQYSVHRSPNQKMFTENSENFRQVAREYLRRYILKNNIICEKFDTNYPITEQFLIDSDKLNTKSFRFFDRINPSNSETGSSVQPISTVDEWLKHLNPRHLQSFTVYSSINPDCTLTVTGNNLNEVNILHILQRSDISDELLDKLTALDIELNPARITVKGINRLIKKWISQKVPLGSRFVYYVDDLKEHSLDGITKNLWNPLIISNNTVNFPISSDRFLRIYVDNDCIEIECLKKK